MTPQLKTPTPNSVWLTKGQPGLTVSALCWTNRTRLNTHSQWHAGSLSVAWILYLRNLRTSVFCCYCVCVWFALTCVCTLSSPRHGWTGRVWSHERTIHEDRGGLPARLLSHWQRKVSDSGLSFPPFILFANLCLLFTITRPLSLLPVSHSTKTVNLSAVLSLVAARTSGPSCCLLVSFFCSHHFLPRPALLNSLICVA